MLCCVPVASCLAWSLSQNGNRFLRPDDTLMVISTLLAIFIYIITI